MVGLGSPVTVQVILSLDPVINTTELSGWSRIRGTSSSSSSLSIIIIVVIIVIVIVIVIIIVIIIIINIIIIVIIITSWTMSWAVTSTAPARFSARHL